jgi:PAS domain S-box-containing protein
MYSVKFSDLVDMTNLQKLLDSLNSVTGIANAVIDVEGTVLAFAGWQDICVNFHRMHPSTGARCTESDSCLARNLLQGKPFVVYDCLNGMVDSATPIIVNGEHLASIYSGQFFTSPPNLEKFRKQAREFDFDEETYLDAVKQAPIISNECVQNINLLHSNIAHILASSGLERLRARQAEKKLLTLNKDLTQLVTERTNDLAAKHQQLLQDQEKLKASESRISSLIQSVDGIVWEADALTFNFTFVSDKAERLLGFSTEEWQQPGFWVNHLHPEDKLWAPDYCASCTNKIEAHDFEYRFIAKDGRTVWLRDIVTVVVESGSPRWLRGLMVDITQRKEAEQARIETDQRFRDVANNSADWIWEIDEHARFTYASASVRKLLGYAPEELIGKSAFDDLMPEAEALRIQREFADMARKGQSFRDLENINLDIYGNEHIMLSSGLPVYDSERKLIGYRGVDRDITEQKALQQDLIKQAKEAKSAVKAKSAFLSHMSHELRTPMNSVLGLSDLLGKTSLDDQQRGYLDNLMASGRILMSVINDILDYSKIEAEKIAIENTAFSLEQLLSDIRNIFLSRVEELPVTLDFAEIDPSIAVLTGDSLHLRQALINLIDNAVKFTPEGLIQVEIRCERRSEKGTVVRFSIKDDGIGVPEESQNRLFDAFLQADSSTTRKYGGTGLGLAITSRLVALMGGHLEFESEEGVGSEFYFTLPFGTASEKDLPHKIDLWDSSLEENAANFKILIAEDNNINQLFIREIMTELGFTNITMVADGRQAIGRLKESDYDLVLMDCQMPIMDGYSATRELRQLEKIRGNGKHIPVIALTAYAMAEDIVRCKDAGMDGHIAKPVDIEELKRMIANWMAPIPSDTIKPAAGEVLADDAPVEFTERNPDDESLASFREEMDPQGWRELMHKCIKYLPQDISKIEEAARLQDTQALRQALHSLEGALSIFGANSLINVCEQVRAMAKKGNDHEIKKSIFTLKGEFDCLINRLTAELDR